MTDEMRGSAQGADGRAHHTLAPRPLLLRLATGQPAGEFDPEGQRSTSRKPLSGDTRQLARPGERLTKDGRWVLAVDRGRGGRRGGEGQAGQPEGLARARARSLARSLGVGVNEPPARHECADDQQQQQLRSKALDRFNRGSQTAGQVQSAGDPGPDPGLRHAADPDQPRRRYCRRLASILIHPHRPPQ